MRAVKALVSNLYELDIQKDIMSEATAQFCSAVASKLRGVKFGSRFQDTAVRTGEHVYVYYPEDRYALGRLHVVCADVGEFVYVYSSRKITNERSKVSEPNTKRTTNLDRAVRDVSKFFVPYTPIEEVIESSDSAREAFRKSVDGARKMHNTVKGMFASLIEEGGYTRWKEGYEREFTSAPDRRDILTELGRIVEQHDFINPNVCDLFVNMVTAEAGYQREETKYKDGCATYVRIINNERAILVEGVPNRDLGRHVVDADKYVVTKVLVQDMPDYVQGAVAVLSMLEVGDSIPDVGLRVHTDTFYVNQKEQ